MQEQYVAQDDIPLDNQMAQEAPGKCTKCQGHQAIKSAEEAPKLESAAVTDTLKKPEIEQAFLAE